MPPIYSVFHTVREARLGPRHRGEAPKRADARECTIRCSFEFEGRCAVKIRRAQCSRGRQITERRETLRLAGQAGRRRRSPGAPHRERPTEESNTARPRGDRLICLALTGALLRWLSVHCAREWRSPLRPAEGWRL